jgi:hypothetical protein
MSKTFQQHLDQWSKDTNRRLNRINMSLTLSTPEPKTIPGYPPLTKVDMTLTTPTQITSGEIYFDLTADEVLMPKYVGRINQSLSDMEKMLRGLPAVPAEVQELANTTGVAVAYVHGDAGANTIMVYPQSPGTDD